MVKAREKVYVYLDESGQNSASRFFVVVAVVCASFQEELRAQLRDIERSTGTGGKKWHKLRHENRMQYLMLVLERKIVAQSVYTAHYKKPIPFFFPMVAILEKAIKDSVHGAYEAQVYVDGIDVQKGKELTNALRACGISLRAVKGRRDESEPLIRLADMWAGCLRSALLDTPGCKKMVQRAEQEHYFKVVT